MAKAATALQQVPSLFAATAVTTRRIESWDDVDNAIRDVARIDLEVEDKENEMNAVITDVQSRLGPRIKELKNQREAIADAALSFAKKHREDFGAKKSRKFNFGTIGFSKLSSKVKFLLEEIQIIANLKKLGLAAGVVKSKEWVDKNALEETVPAEKRDKVGFEVEETGDEPQLKIDKKAIEIMRESRSKSGS